MFLLQFNNFILWLDLAAFSGSGLTSVTIPTSVTIIGTNNNHYYSLTVITITPSGDWTFFKVPLTSVTIPTSITSIGELHHVIFYYRYYRYH